MTLERTLRCGFVLCAFSALFPSSALAQSQNAAIAGVVKDAAGAVLPGVTVEASSPALIEKTRTAVTDRQGAYKIVELRPGAYTVTFTMAGFSTVVREGLELPSSFTATVNADMRMGTVEETVTVSGEEHDRRHPERRQQGRHVASGDGRAADRPQLHQPRVD